MSIQTITAGDNVSFPTSDLIWHVWAVDGDVAFIARPDGKSHRANQPVEGLQFVERPNCHCHTREG